MSHAPKEFVRFLDSHRYPVSASQNYDEAYGDVDAFLSLLLYLAFPKQIEPLFLRWDYHVYSRTKYRSVYPLIIVDELP